jgi:hypothetical protein
MGPYGSPTYEDDSPLTPTILWNPGGGTTSNIDVTQLQIPVTLIH